MSRRIRTLIVDDEPHARAGIRRILEAHPRFEVAGEARDGREAVAGIRMVGPDLVLLDVQMPGFTGFDVIRDVGPGRMPFVIFVTAYDEFALHAFEVNALDYVLKPFTNARFRSALEKAAAAIENREYRDLGERLLGLVRDSPAAAPPIEPAPTVMSHIAVRSDQRVLLIRTEEIDWIEAASYYARLHVGKESYLVRETLNSLEARLPPRCSFVCTGRPS